MSLSGQAGTGLRGGPAGVEPAARIIRETSTGADLIIGDVADTNVLFRSSTTFIGAVGVTINSTGVNLTISGTLRAGAAAFNVTAAGAVSTTSTLAVGTTGQFAVTAAGAVSTSGAVSTTSTLAVGTTGQFAVTAAGAVSTTSTLAVGTTGQFTVNATGNITKLNGVTMTFPSANAPGALTNDAAGNLTWAANTSPVTTKGDVYTFSTTAARLAVGTDGHVLTAASAETTGLKWSDPRIQATVAKSSAYTLTDADGTIFITTASTMTLPTPVGRAGKQFTVVHATATGSSTVTTAAGSIYPSPTSLTGQGTARTYRSDGTNWFIVSWNT